MLASLATQRPRGARIARRVLAASAAVTLLMVVFHGWNVMVDDPSNPRLIQMATVERDGDFVAWTDAFAPRAIVSVRAFASGADDTILLRKGDLAALLAGEAYTPIERFGSQGAISFAPPMPDCPPPTGGCIDATLPVLVWIRGDAWRGATPADARYYNVEQTIGQESSASGDGPVSPMFVATKSAIVDRAPAWSGLVAASVGASLVATIWWVVVEWRHARASRGEGPALKMGKTDDMLALVHLSSLYVDSIRRSFLLGAVLIPFLAATVMFFALPLVWARTFEQFGLLSPLLEMHLLVFSALPAYLAAVALVFWGVEYARVRRELSRWRDLARRFDDEARRILGA